MDPTTPLERESITGLVLAGGRGVRMGGVDKGLQPWHGRPMVDHVLERLAPQVGAVVISANRSLDDYALRGTPVVQDAETPFNGPLAGILAGLRACTSDWLAIVPCDAPRLPRDLVARLSTRAMALAVPGVYAVHHESDGDRMLRRAEPLFCLLRADAATRDSLAATLAAGERRVERWLGALGAQPCDFDAPQDTGAFANFTRLEDLGQSRSGDTRPA